MQLKQRDLFTTIHTEGSILPTDLLQRVSNWDASLGGLRAEDYHLSAGVRINEEINRSWNNLLGDWKTFQKHRQQLQAEDRGAQITRERWLFPLFKELHYGRLLPAKSLEIEGKSYPISHFWLNTPIHLVGSNIDLDTKTPGVAGAARSSPHSLVQEFLNRSNNSLWGLVSNGLKLRVLRDNIRLTRQAFVEFDLEAMMEGEVYADFSLLWMLCHQSRVESEKPEECWLEQWSKTAQEEGTRALEQLRKGVEDAISFLGKGFLEYPANQSLREKLQQGRLDTQEYFRQLLRLVYRLIFLFVAEDRGLLLTAPPDSLEHQRYSRFYSTARLRRLAERNRGGRHPDLFQGLKVVMQKLGQDGYPPLGLPALGSFLWSDDAIPGLVDCGIQNRSFLDAIRALAFTQAEGARRSVDYKNLGSEELGSVYESLLELHPELDVNAKAFELKTAAGHERKTTGSYYTPTSLINCLLDSALDPVVDAACKKDDPEQALLGLKICDPACGSGHFLVAAANRVAKRLAAIRTGDEEPSPQAIQKAKRDVIGHCVYGVDLNPMSVELCKTALWMEALEPGKPLSFLDHRIRRGNSLLGVTPTLLREGIPDSAFNPIEGDDKAVCATYKKRNREQRNQQGFLFDEDDSPWENLGNLAAGYIHLDRIADDTLEGIREKQQTYEDLVKSSDYKFGHLLADAWCAAFVWEKTKPRVDQGFYPITQDIFLNIKHSINKGYQQEIIHLAEQYRFFHWHLEFPDVFRWPPKGEPPENPQTGWNGGFDVVLGNPPWERIKLQEKEWFANRVPTIANAPNAAARGRMIQNLRMENPLIYEAFIQARRTAEGESHLVRDSGRFPRCGRGDINTYSIFAETKRLILSSSGRVGCIVPSGIATDDTTKAFFQDLMESNSLVSLFDFENRDGTFPGVHRSYKFTLLTLTGSQHPASSGVEFVFFAHQTGDLREEDRRFQLTAEEIQLLNPNTRTCPVFRSKRDTELTKYIYRRVPVLIQEGPPEVNPWGITFLRMIDMANDSHLFRTREQLEAEGYALRGNVFEKGDEVFLPLYEAKMIHHFDHRWATYNGLDTRDVILEEKRNPNFSVLPRYWVPAGEVDAILKDKGHPSWLLGWRDITNTTNERTVIANVIPRVGVGHTCPLFFSDNNCISSIPALQSNLSSMAFDFAARQKIGGTHLTYGYLNQLPIFTPDSYDRMCPWLLNFDIFNWLTYRILELTFTAWDLEPFAQDCGYDGPPFIWDEERRFLIRCELDAAYFHLYLGNLDEWQEQGSPELRDYFATPREAVEYILETFPIVKRKDEQKYGEYRTMRVILEIYDAMAEAIRTGRPYATRLDPPPGPPEAGLPAWPPGHPRPAAWPPHIHPPKWWWEREK
ncbi:MAG: Eco57I restriction-modification methylase domain-containing protein [bacterium]